VLASGVLDIDTYAAIIPLRTGQRWLAIDDAVTDVIVFARDFESVPSLATQLREDFSGRGLEVLSWNEINPMAEQWSQFANVSSWIILGIVIFVVMAEVLNTMLMSMHERTRELGMMGALGVTHWQIFTMVLWETLILVVIGSLLGFTLGAWVSAYFGEHGIDLSRWAVAFSFSYMESVVYPELSLDSVKNVLGAAVIGAFVAGLYPAWKAARLEPTIAMRQV
jgi:putative ABC transport system permease protein